MRIALAQTDVSLGDVDANLARTRETVERAGADGADLVVFPELSLSGYAIGTTDADPVLDRDDDRLGSIAPDPDGPAAVVGYPELSAGLHVYNAAAHVRGGRVGHVHRKLYLPTYAEFEERKHFSPGSRIRAFDADGPGRMAILTCNDAWQPQVPFIAVQDAARVLVVPAASPRTTPDRPWRMREYWRDLTRFYARMLQVWVVFVNRVGTEPGLDFWGGSHVVDPWGEVVAAADGDDEQLLAVEVDPASVRERRREVPLVKEARLAVLQRELRRLADEGGDL